MMKYGKVPDPVEPIENCAHVALSGYSLFLFMFGCRILDGTEPSRQHRRRRKVLGFGVLSKWYTCMWRNSVRNECNSGPPKLVDLVRLVQQERVQRRTAEVAVDVVELVSQERVQQRAAEQIEDAPQFRAEISEAVEVTEVTVTSSQDPWLRTLEQFLDETRHESFSRFWRGFVS